MNARQFDRFTKAFSARESRRGLLASTVGAAGGWLLGLVSFAARLEGNRAEAEAEDPVAKGIVCPGCGDCQACVIDSSAGTMHCGLPCEDANGCLGAKLCKRARRDAGYQLLYDRLADEGFVKSAN